MGGGASSGLVKLDQRALDCAPGLTGHREEHLRGFGVSDPSGLMRGAAALKAARTLAHFEPQTSDGNFQSDTTCLRGDGHPLLGRPGRRGVGGEHPSGRRRTVQNHLRQTCGDDRRKRRS